MRLVWMQCLAIGTAGFFGAIARYLVSALCGRLFGTAFPVGTLMVNLTGCLCLGWFLTVIRERYPVSDTFRLAVAVGFIGTYTTFSTFVYESSLQLEDGSGMKAIVNMFGSILLGLLAIRLGMWLAT